jgi:hypothetical protein
MSSGLEAYKSSLNGHIRNLRENVTSLLSSLHTAGSGNDAKFYTHVEHTKEAISDFRKFLGPGQPSPVPSELAIKLEEFRQNPHSVDLIRYLVDVYPNLLRLAGGAHETKILEDQIRSLVDDEQLKCELEELEAKLTELINEKGNEVSYNLMQEIQRLVDLLRQSKSRSILEVIVKSDGLYNAVAAAADAHVGAPCFTILKELAGIVFKIKKTALSKVEDRLLEYQDVT